jgi:hypothetical protein
MVRRRVSAISNHEASLSVPGHILRDAAELVIGPGFAWTRWRLLRMRGWPVMTQ